METLTKKNTLPSFTVSVHMTISEGAGVLGIANILQKFTNSSHSFTIRDCKEVPISDSTETKGLIYMTPLKNMRELLDDA